jgi:hypothetical protein
MNFYALLFLALFVAAMFGFYFYTRRRPPNLRDIQAYYRLGSAIELAVEDGSRVHVALGSADLTGPRSPAALVGLSMLNRITSIAAISDHPPVASAGSGALAILAQDTIKAASHSQGAPGNYDPNLGQVLGLTPFSYAAGTLPLIRETSVSTNLLAGSFNEEIGLMTTTGEQSQTLTIGGSDSIPAQAILYATAHEPLIGEEFYAGGAYIGAGPMHIASLHAQDVIRWILIAAIIGGGFFELISALAP